nr:acetylajmalan esterase-like [Ipomoea trifida]
MASLFLLTALFLLPFSYATVNPLTKCSFKSIYQFGDSLADTGNLFRIPGATMSFHADRHPYGQTYFGKPTGRFSDGRLIVDYVAAALKLPFVDAYLDANGSFAHGANFAVAGGTALDNSFFAERNISMPSFNTPISAQLRWFHAHLNATCGGAGRKCAEKVQNALFIFGEFGGNDYYNALSKGKSLEETKTYVPYTVDAVINAIKHIVKHGAKRVVVPGTLPFGCLPVYLTNFPSSDPKSYDQLGCLKSLNDFSSYHNNYLQKALSKLSRELSGDVVLVYGDYYGALRSVLRRGSYLGFNNESLLKACCGTGGKYNFDGSKTCGSDGVSACSNPAQYVHWDGIHLTDKSYLRMTEILIRKVLRNIKCS